MRHHLDFINDVLCADAEGTADKALLRAYKCGEWRGCDGLEQLFYAMRFRNMPVGKFKQLVRDAENVNLNEPEIILVQFSGNGIIAVDGPAFLPSKAIPCATLIADGKLTPEARHHLEKERRHHAGNFNTLYRGLTARSKRLFDALVQRNGDGVEPVVGVRDLPYITVNTPRHEILVLGGRYHDDFCLVVRETGNDVDGLAVGAQMWDHIAEVPSGDIDAAASEVHDLRDSLLGLEVLDTALEYLDSGKIDTEAADDVDI